MNDRSHWEIGALRRAAAERSVLGIIQNCHSFSTVVFADGQRKEEITSDPQLAGRASRDETTGGYIRRRLNMSGLPCRVLSYVSLFMQLHVRVCLLRRHYQAWGGEFSPHLFFSGRDGCVTFFVYRRSDIVCFVGLMCCFFYPGVFVWML
jgi:hypothetical protein